QQAQNFLVEAASNFSKLCSDLSNEIKMLNNSSQASLKVDQLFKYFLNWNRELSTKVNEFLETITNLDSQISRLSDEKKKLEVLYSSGILFTSKKEKKSLMESALDIVVKELNADAGFITLMNERDEIDSIFSKNMLLNDNPDALEISTTVIRNTIKSLKPVQIENTIVQKDYAEQVSIIRLV
ncbi:MAG TPA: hypothetical protein PK559_14475, partial [Ignavibacteriaceae bacterium]|nr:hypothetical protein [Ignavibacteriaceae bacterium]